MKINKSFSSPNYSTRTQKIEYIVVHYTEMTFEGALTRLTDPSAKVSAHYLIKEDGEIFQLVADDQVAWHAGISYWQGKTEINQYSIGIELDNLGNGQFSTMQLDACLELTQELMEKYNILSENFIGHSDVAPDRKIDPGIFFNWQFFAGLGIGIWHNLQLSGNPKTLYSFGDRSKNIEDLQYKLQKLGYGIVITGEFDLQTNFVIRAFQAKFYPTMIQQLGLEFYQDNTSHYSWDSESEQILEELTGV